MFIVPISNTITPIESAFDKNEKTQNLNSPAFTDVFKEVFNDVKDTQAQSQEDSVKLVSGDIDDLHTIYNNMTKAAVAVETFVAVKNAAVDAYNQTLQISL